MYTEIRKLSKKEKEFVKNLIDYSKRDKLDEFQVGRILSKELDFMGIKCDNLTKEVIIYKANQADANKSYNTIMNLCNFLAELELFGYIGVDAIVNKNGITYDDIDSFWVYNHKKYSVINDDLFIIKDGIKMALNEGTPLEKFHSEKLYSAIINYVYNKVIYPLPVLTELYNNNFISIEEKRHKQNVKLQWAAIILTPIITAILSSTSATKIISDDLMHIDNKLEQLLIKNTIIDDTKDIQVPLITFTDTVVTIKDKPIQEK